MATSTYPAEFSMYSNVDSAVAIALILHRATRGALKQGPFIRDVSQLLYRLRERGIRFRDLGLRRIPDGFYSEDVETFVGQLLSMGYATQRSPIRLKEKGVALCEEIVKEETERNKDEVEKLGKVVDEELSTLAASA